jgi:NADPH2:quinone reductase
MKAVICTELGHPKLLEIKDVEIPKPSEDEVLIKVEAAGVNYPDALLVQGKYQIVVNPPFTPGNEVCGYIDKVGKNVNLTKGMKVIGLPEIGGLSEYVSVNKNLVIPISDKITSVAYKLWNFLLRSKKTS